MIITVDLDRLDIMRLAGAACNQGLEYSRLGLFDLAAELHRLEAKLYAAAELKHLENCAVNRNAAACVLAT